MDAVTYLKEKSRMCDEYLACVGCPLGKLAYCVDAEPEETVKVVEEWSKEHPFMTNGGKLMRSLPVEAIVDDKRTDEVTIKVPRRWWDAEYKGE